MSSRSSRVRRVVGKLRRSCSVAAFLLAGASSLVAQATLPRDPQQALTQYKIDNWQTEQGLPLNTVQALLQTRDGATGEPTSSLYSRIGTVS